MDSSILKLSANNVLHRWRLIASIFLMKTLKIFEIVISSGVFAVIKIFQWLLEAEWVLVWFSVSITSITVSKLLMIWCTLTSSHISSAADSTSLPPPWLEIQFATRQRQPSYQPATCSSGKRKLSPESEIKSFPRQDSASVSIKKLFSLRLRVAVAGTEFPTTLAWFRCACWGCLGRLI